MKLYFLGTRHATSMRGRITNGSVLLLNSECGNQIEHLNKPEDRHRKIITRWRLSNHKLRIETGRYQVPFVQREDRKCYRCDIIENETHAIYDCPSFAFIRCNFTNLLEKYPTVELLLNPEPSDIYEVASLLSEIDDVLSKR